MISKDYVVSAAEGIHARPAASLVKMTKNYKSVFFLKKGERQVALNSMLNILSLGAKGGETVTLLVEGEDEAEAAMAVDRFFIHELKLL